MRQSHLKFRIWKRTYCPTCEFPTIEVYEDINEAILTASERSMRAIKADKLYMFFPVPEEEAARGFRRRRSAAWLD